MRDEEFEWDDNKAETNLRDHQVSFQTARRVFADWDKLEDFDSDSGFGEDRFFCIGAVGLDVYYVTYTVLDDDRTRIISARPATKRETNAYYRGKTGG